MIFKKFLPLLAAGIFSFSAVNTGLNALAAGKPITVNIETLGDQLKFNKTEITVQENSQVTLVFKNKSTGMAHNWVLTVKGMADKISTEGITFGEAKSYVNKDNKNVLAFTPSIKPGKTGTITFKAPKKGTYDFVCSFPGHNMMMKGKLIVK